jgi:diaminopimelate epimerase
VQLSKHHGLGNDFLVLLDLDGTSPVEPALARRLCDRRTGIGADGLLWAGPGTDGADVTMTLHNADGSRAEMSGNGIRCLAQQVARSRGTDDLDLVVATDAGLRRVEVRPAGADTVQVRVAMGAITVAAAPELGLAAKDTMGASVGNPHVVALYADRSGLDAAADAFAMTDRNVEFIVPGPGEDELTMRVVERGAGETRACGTGACAAAWAAHRWGLVGEAVTVHMPGGSAHVELGDDVFLTGPAVHVADIVLPEERGPACP